MLLVGERLPMTTKMWYKDNLQLTILDHYWQTGIYFIVYNKNEFLLLVETGGVLLSPKLTKNNGILVVSDGMYPFFGVQPVLLNPKRGVCIITN